MATETSSIDDLLTGSIGKTVQNEIPENEENDYHESSDTPSMEQEEAYDAEANERAYEEPESTEQEIKDNKQELDDYGNEKPKSRVYTEEEVSERINKAIRERLARGNHPANQQPTEQQVQQQSKDFEYNPESDDSWQAQLEQFVKQTINKVSQEEVNRHKQIQEQQAEYEFRGKFHEGMEKFSDFQEIVGDQPITDAMTLSLRGFKDPASFIYAASKRHTSELQRISQLKDPYSQIVEMGKLEERMRKSPQATKAPRPISRTSEDSTIKFKEKETEPTIEELISKAEQKKLSQIKKFRGK